MTGKKPSESAPARAAADAAPASASAAKSDAAAADAKPESPRIRAMKGAHPAAPAAQSTLARTVQHFHVRLAAAAIQRIVALLDKSAEDRDARLVLRALRLNTVVRKHASAEVLREALEHYVPETSALRAPLMDNLRTIAAAEVRPALGCCAVASPHVACVRACKPRRLAVARWKLTRREWRMPLRLMPRLRRLPLPRRRPRRGPPSRRAPALTRRSRCTSTCSLLQACCSTARLSRCGCAPALAFLRASCRADCKGVQALASATAMFQRTQQHNRRTMDPLSSRVYHYFGRANELAGRLSDIRGCARVAAERACSTRLPDALRAWQRAAGSPPDGLPATQRDWPGAIHRRRCPCRLRTHS